MRVDAKAVRYAARGRWEFIFKALCPKLISAMQAAERRGKDTHVPCPIHGGKDGFRLFQDWKVFGSGVCNTCPKELTRDGFALLMSINKWGFDETLRSVANVLGLTSTAVAKIPVAPQWTPPEKPTVEDLRNSAERSKVRRCWKQAIPFDRKDASAIRPMTRYLEGRGLKFESVSQLRFFPKSGTYSNGAYVEFPAMVAAIRNVEGDIVSLHRTFLTNIGKKAPVEKVKRVMKLNANDSITGCAIHFGEPDSILALAEGIETALSVVKATGFACWSCVSACGLESVVIPKRVKRVLVFADKDKSFRGARAAQKLSERMQALGVRVTVYYPTLPLNDAKSVDFNDEIKVLGPEAFPIRNC